MATATKPGQDGETQKPGRKCRLSGLTLILVAHAAMMFVSITFSLWNVLAEQVVEKKASAKLGFEPNNSC